MKITKLINFFLLMLVIAKAHADDKEVDIKNNSNERRTLVLAGDYWCPYNCDPNSKDPGYLVELLRRALYIYRIDIDYKLMPWSKAIDLAEEGKIDGILGISSVEGRDLVATKLPVEYSITHAFTRNDTEWIYDGIGSLRGKTIGIILDYVVDEAISHYVGSNYHLSPGKFSVQEGEDAAIESIVDLINGESDVYIEDHRVVEHYIAENSLDSYVRDAGRVGRVKLPVYIAFSKKLPHVKTYINFFTNGLASLKATGEFDHLRSKYKMKDEEFNTLPKHNF
jgi:polar amino acid transport system substrate-binding protein